MRLPLPRIAIFELQLRVIAPVANPQAAYWLLAPVHNLCEAWDVRLASIVMSLFALRCISWHGATLAQLLDAFL